MKTSGRRAAATMGVVVGMALLAGLVAAVAGRPSSPAGPVYTVAQVLVGLTRQPAAWAGRTVLVRGTPVSSAWVTGPTSGAGINCAPPRPRRFGSLQPCSLPLVAPNGTALYLQLVDDSARLYPMRPLPTPQQPNTWSLVVVVQPVVPNPLIVLARRLPLLTRFLPAQRQVPSGVSRLYRIRLRPTSSVPCANQSPLGCATGALVAAQP